MSICWNKLVDPLDFAKKLWPNVYFYDKQREIIYSTVWNRMTVVPAGNELGKDFVSAFIALYFFLTRKPVRIVTTSSKDQHLRVLWGEIKRFIQNSNIPLDVKDGGPLIVNHQEIKKIVDGKQCGISYILGMVCGPDTREAMQGHHATPDNLEDANDGLSRTLFISDESSSIRDEIYTMVKTWAKTILMIGNTWACENEFKHSVKGRPGVESDRGGNIPDDNVIGRFLRKVIRIKAADSPNVQYGLMELALGLKPSNKMLVPGVKSYEKYRVDRLTMNKIEQCVSLDADFYAGADQMMYPPDWMNLAEAIADALELKWGRNRTAKGIGIDTAEGGDDTSMTGVDDWGVIKMESKKTPNTNVIIGETIAFMNEMGVPQDEAWRVCFDLGGGGKEHVDRLRDMGYDVRTVAFGESVVPGPRRTRQVLRTRKDEAEDRYAYVNRRAQMYWNLRQLLDPGLVGTSLGKMVLNGFGLPRKYYELRRQLSPIPLRYDNEGRIRMLPKYKKTADSEEECLTDLIGCSPDEADSLVLAVHAMLFEPKVAAYGAMVL